MEIISTDEYSFLTALEIEISLRASIDAALHEKYGPAPEPAIAARVRDEWDALIASGTILEAAALYEITRWLKARKIPYWCRSKTGSSFLFYLLGISQGNPLPPHTYCPQCRAIHWRADVKDGFDIRVKYNWESDEPGAFTIDTSCVCNKDGTPLVGDGHNVPWQGLWGYDGHVMEQDSYYIDMDETAFDELRRMLDNHWLHRLEPEAKLTWPHPPFQLLRYSCITLRCCLDHENLPPTFYDKELTEEVIPIAWVLWRELSGYFDREWVDYHVLMEKWHGPPPSDDVGINGDYYDELMIKRPELPESHSFADTVYAYGLCHSTNLWNLYSGFLVREFGYSLTHMVPFQEDHFEYLRAHGFSERDAWYGMTYVQKYHRGFPAGTAEMYLSPDLWIQRQCSGRVYPWSKASAVEYILFRLRKLLS